MLRSVTVLLAALLFVSSATAQDTTGLQRAIERLSSPPSADELAALGASDPNAYVYFLQGYLKGKGSYGGLISGQLTNATIGAIVSFCREVGIAETCIRGPMLPESIEAVSDAVAAALTPGVDATPVAEAAPTPAAEPVVVAEPAVAEVAKSAVLPEGWQLNDNGGRGTLGLTIELISTGPAEAVIRFSGTAEREGYFNIQLGPRIDSTTATWGAQVSAQRDSAAGTAGDMWFRTALMGDKAYLGEMFRGVPVAVGADMKTLKGSGVPSTDTLRIFPYVQLWVKAGDRVDTTIHLANPSIAARP